MGGSGGVSGDTRCLLVGAQRPGKPLGALTGVDGIGIGDEKTMAGSTEYIPHHLEHLRYDLTKGEWAHGTEGIVNFHLINVDSMIMASVLGLVFLLIFTLAARRATVGVPGKFQAFVELVVESHTVARICGRSPKCFGNQRHATNHHQARTAALNL